MREDFLKMRELRLPHLFAIDFAVITMFSMLIRVFVTFLLANFVGIALGFALSLILIYVINKQSFGWTIRFHWPVAILLGALTVVYAATVIAGLYPARVAVRLNPIEVVHEE